MLPRAVLVRSAALAPLALLRVLLLLLLLEPSRSTAIIKWAALGDDADERAAVHKGVAVVGNHEASALASSCDFESWADPGAGRTRAILNVICGVDV